MNKQELFSLAPLEADREIYAKVKKRWDSLTKPIDGLGDFESLICTIASIRKTTAPDISRRAAVIMCSDNGIVEENISQSGQDITLLVAQKLGRGTSSVCVLSSNMNVDVIPVDMGINCSESIPGVLDMKVCRGTRNFLKAPAMTESEMLNAISGGIRTAELLKERGYGLCAAGEMGIGNTTTSAAVLSVLLDTPADSFAGRGAGLDDSGLIRKKEVICRGVSLYDFSGKNSRERAFEAVRCLGGADIAGLAGLFIGCALNGIPVILDGLITACAALAAERMVPGTRECLIASHKGRESGCLLALAELGLRPYIDGNMALGEGTGAVLMLPLADAAMNFYMNSGRFESDGMTAYKRFDKK